MKNELKLFMVVLGCTPKGRFTEQHDVFFGIGKSLKDLVPEMKAFWPEAKGKIHIDSWREITAIENHTIKIKEKNSSKNSDKKLFFINLGGYKENDPEEYHYKLLAVGKKMSDVIKKSKKTAFFKHCTLPGTGASHIDDKYGIDVDDVYNINDVLDQKYTSKFDIEIEFVDEKIAEDTLHVGYVKIAKL